ncbi:hypothetical protein LR68_03369 [Anoxybacillus sp. BCO1]|nr:hypothetical protein LR68_03369 [Anoxybacillus sp. BCO1]
MSEQRLSDLEARIVKLEKEAAAATTAEVTMQGNVTITPEEFRAILDRAPIIDLNKAQNNLFAESIKPYNVSKEFGLDEC